MKKTLSLLALSLCILSLLHADEEDSLLEGQMKILARGTRQLGQQISNPSMQQENIVLLETLKKAATNAKTFEPRKTKEIPEAKRAAFLADFQTDLDELRDSLDQVEQALKASDYAKARSLLSPVNSIKKESHAKFKQD